MKYIYPGAGVLSVHPNSTGFSFILFEEALAPFDWGTKRIRGKDINIAVLHHVKDLIDKYRPEALVIEDYAEKGSRRSLRIRRLYRAITHMAKAECVEVFHYSKASIQECFESVGASNRHDIAAAIAREIPAFIGSLPRRRRAQDAEDPRQALFRAAALGITHYMVTGSEV